jgi:hypothetical protein
MLNDFYLRLRQIILNVKLYILFHILDLSAIPEKIYYPNDVMEDVLGLFL